MSIVQFTRFRVGPGQRAAVLEARRASLLACQGSEPALRAAYLVRLDDAEWLDIAVWDSRPGNEAFDDPAQAASRAVFYGMLDELLGEECGILVEDIFTQLAGPDSPGSGERSPGPADPSRDRKKT